MHRPAWCTGAAAITHGTIHEECESHLAKNNRRRDELRWIEIGMNGNGIGTGVLACMRCGYARGATLSRRGPPAGGWCIVAGAILGDPVTGCNCFSCCITY